MRPVIATLVASLLSSAPALALNATVTPQEMKISNFTFESGETIPELRMGYEVYGTLNSTRDNVVLLSHFLNGDKHAAGSYAGQTEKGWWDVLIGPGQAIDTNKFCVVSVDLPICMQVKKSTVVTTGPRSIDPLRGEPYGPRFPRTTIIDMVRAQRALVDQLGIRHLAAVSGPSLGGMVAWQWSIQYPDFVDVVIPVGGPVRFNAFERMGFEQGLRLIGLDPSYAFGEYQRTGLEPSYGIALALAGLTQANSAGLVFIPAIFPYLLYEASKLDANTYIRNMELHLEYELGREYGSLSSALSRVRAKVALIGFADDKFVTKEELGEAQRALRAEGVREELIVLRGGNGHLSVLDNASQMAATFKRLLPTP